MEALFRAQLTSSGTLDGPPPEQTEPEMSTAEIKARIKEMEAVVGELQYVMDTLKNIMKAEVEKKRKEKGV